MIRRIHLLLAAAAFVAATGVAQAQTKTMQTAAGTVLTDEKGMTLYVFDKDEPGKSNCYQKCAQNWPPLPAGMAGGDYSVVERTDGVKQLAYKGKPLYLWVKDTKPGDTTGDGFNSVWHVAMP